jgi:t-SNARE complex subunit (syntaxin)
MADEDFSGDELIQVDLLLADERNKEICKLVASINELSTLFKEMGMLILEQGTLLDRIDYNLEQTIEHVERAKEELVKAD